MAVVKTYTESQAHAASLADADVHLNESIASVESVTGLAWERNAGLVAAHMNVRVQCERLQYSSAFINITADP